MLSIDLPEDVNNRLELLSLSSGRTVQFYIREAILEYLDDVAIRYDTMDKASADIPFSLGEVGEEFGLENRL